MDETRNCPDAGFQVDPWVHALGGLVERRPGLWTRLGNLETRLLGAELAGIDIKAPIYVAGMARSGSTLLLEVLEWHEHTGSHRYRDFPMLYTPHLWNRFLDRVPLRRQAPAERAHRDGMIVSADSPEAFEELLWMAFFPDIHDPAHSAVLDARTRQPAFESFYCICRFMRHCGPPWLLKVSGASIAPTDRYPTLL